MERMETTVKVTKEKFATLRTGRATPSLLDLVKVGTQTIYKRILKRQWGRCSSRLRLVFKCIQDLAVLICCLTLTWSILASQVDYYGAPTQLRSLANITAPESSLLVVQPFDKGSMEAIEKAIMQANLGFTPNNDGKVIRINVPQLTAVRGLLCKRAPHDKAAHARA